MGLIGVGTQHGSGQGQNLALTGVFVSSSLESGSLCGFLDAAPGATRWTTRVSFPESFGGNVTKFPQYKAVK